MTLFGLFKQKTTTTQHSSPAKASFRQEKERAALLVTNELDKALEECKSKVERIARDCRAQNRKFRDIEFDIENDKARCLNGLSSSDETYTPSDVQRVTQIFDDPHFFIDGADSADIVQGALGNCWFLSALATMATAKGLVERFCVARDEKVGVYGFIFFRDTAWVTVIIDDLLFTSIPKFEELSYQEKQLYHNDKDKFNRSARKGSKSLYFSKSGTEGETWVPLIEKAYAKLHGDYAALSGGEACEAIEDLTGGVSTFIPSKDILDPDRFWTDELLKANHDRLFGCAYDALDGSRSGNYNATVNGLIGSHAYSVLRAVEYRGKRFVVVRNPWGQTEWTGRWSDGSKEWTAEWLPALEALGHTFGDDGEFVMEYDDFLASWEQIDRTILFDSSWAMSSQWLHVTARKLPSAWSFGDVSFTISLPEPSYTIVVLSKLDDRFFNDISGRSLWSFDFVIFKKGETEHIITSSHARFYSRSVNAELHLPAGDYVIHVRLDRVMFREAGYFEAAAPNWSERKLSRVLAERAKSQSIASNFRADLQAVNLPIPLETIAGHDLAELETKAREAAEQLRKEVAELQAAETETVTASAEFTQLEKNALEAAEEMRKKIEEADTVTVVTETLTLTSAVVTPSPAISDKTEERVQASTSAAEEENGDAKPDSTASEETHSEAPKPEEDAEPIVAPPENSASVTPPVPDEDDSVFLGLRVYTNRAAPAVIGGQLRHEMEVSFTGLSVAGL